MHVTSFEISLLVFACVFGGALAGMFLGRCCRRIISATTPRAWSTSRRYALGLVRPGHRPADLLRQGRFRCPEQADPDLAADLILLDRVMRQYGPETDEARELLRRYTALKIALTGRRRTQRTDPARTTRPRSRCSKAFRQAADADPAERGSALAAVARLADRRRARGGSLAAGGGKRGLGPAALSRDAGVMADRPVRQLRPVCPTPCHRCGGAVRVRAFLSAAIFLILEMDRPFDGFITISATPMRSALAHMGA